MYNKINFVPSLGRHLNRDALRIYKQYLSRVMPLVESNTPCRAYFWHDGSRGRFGVYRLDTCYKPIRNTEGEIVKELPRRMTDVGRRKLERIIAKLRKRGVLLSEWTIENPSTEKKGA